MLTSRSLLCTPVTLLANIILTSSSCLRNLVTLFSILDKENSWRKSVGKPAKFQLGSASKPIVALGAERPLAAIRTLADYYRRLPFYGLHLDLLADNFEDGRDGLGGTHSTVSRVIKHTSLFPEKS